LRAAGAILTYVWCELLYIPYIGHPLLSAIYTFLMSANGLLLVEQGIPGRDKPVRPGIPPRHDYILSWDHPALFMGFLPLGYIWLALINIPLLGDAPSSSHSPSRNHV